jgi:hypothetical protein
MTLNQDRPTDLKQLMKPILRTFSSGGGVQSTAALILSAQGRIDFPVHLWANVGDDSEHPATLAYVRDVLQPYAAEHGIEFHELRREKRDGSTETLYGQLVKKGSRSLPIPVRMSNGAPGTRSCTADFKIRVLNKWHKAHGATATNPAHVGIGFSTDEFSRVGNARKRVAEIVEYPLLDLGLSRADCMEITRKAGLPPAPKSACWFCPMHRPSTWREMRRDEPVLFRKSVELEDLLNERRDMLGKDHVYFTRFNKPLDEAIAAAQDSLFPDEDGWGAQCDEGTCFV